MRCGSGVLHEEFWESRPDQRTDIELFQIWINSPRERKFEDQNEQHITVTGHRQRIVEHILSTPPLHHE